MDNTVTQLNNWLQILLLVILLSIKANSFEISAAEAETKVETEEEKTLAMEVESLESPDLRNDRLIAEQLTVGETKWLNTGKTKFLGILKKDTSGKNLGRVLILPSPRSAPNAPGALSYLSNELSENGWNTLAISLPEFNFSGPAPHHPSEEKGDAQQKEPDENNQSETAMVEDKNTGIPDLKTWYEKQQTKNMEMLLERILVSEAELRALGGQYVILAQGATAELLLELISSKVVNPNGLITLNIQHPVAQRISKIPTNLAKITIPNLDVFNLVITGQAKKRKSMQKGTNYRQIYVPGNGVHFKGSEPLLYKSINGWLKAKFSK